jgi:hypothetical protein
MSAKKKKQRKAMLSAMHGSLDKKVKQRIDLEDFKEETRKRIK